MKYFAQSTFNYISHQIERVEKNSKLMFMLPSLPPDVIKTIGDMLVNYCSEHTDLDFPLIKVASSLAMDWKSSNEQSSTFSIEEFNQKGWIDENENLTSYRNLNIDSAKTQVVLLFGVDRITDSSSLADFHHCDFGVIWARELGCSFKDWISQKFEAHQIGYEKESVEHFEWILQPIIKHGLADILQISTLLQLIDLSAAQDGRDAENLLLSSLDHFGLPDFSKYRFINKSDFGKYIELAVAFFSYDAFLEDRSRKKALTTIQKFVENHELGEFFDQEDRRSFTSDDEFIEALSEYIISGDQNLKTKLLDCDFITINNRILGFRPPRQKRAKRAPVRKLSGDIFEVLLLALWTTLGEYKKIARDKGFLAHETLKSISITSQEFKHDLEGESTEARRNAASNYLSRLLGGIDQVVERFLDGALDQDINVKSSILHGGLDYTPARTAEPFLRFSVLLHGDELTSQKIKKQFAWRLPDLQADRVAEKLIFWRAEVSRLNTGGYCLPGYHLPYYEELLLAKDDEETRRVLLQCINDEGGVEKNLLSADELDENDPMLAHIERLAFMYDKFMNEAREEGLYSALFAHWDDLRIAYERASDAYLTDPKCSHSPLAAMLFRAFLIISRRSKQLGENWVWDKYEESAIVTVLHPSLLEMIQARISFLFTAFLNIARHELRSSYRDQSFSENLWQGYLDLSVIQMPLSGLIKDQNRILNTDFRGNGNIHRIGSIAENTSPLTTRLLLQYDSFDDENISDAELFRSSRESKLLSRVLLDYRDLHPHAKDGVSVAIYQNDDIQPFIAAIDEYLKFIYKSGHNSERPFVFDVTVFTESSDDTSITRWIGQWQERWESAESQSSLSHYHETILNISHRIVDPENQYSQFKELIKQGLDVDIVILNEFIRAGSRGNEFSQVAPYDVTSRLLKFPILEKSFCSLKAPGKSLTRARVISNRQFRISNRHAEIMARLKNEESVQGSQHVVLGYGDYQPWQGVVDALHEHAEWIVCIDPNVDERLLAQKASDTKEAREIIGFGSGVGIHGEANYTISTELFSLADILHKISASIQEIYSDWSQEEYSNVAQSVIRESRKLSGLSLVRATGVGQHIREFMANSLTRMLCNSSGVVLCDQLISLDAYYHWFYSAETNSRPDLLWLTVIVAPEGHFQLDMRLIECKLAQQSDIHIEKARNQLESGLRHLTSVFMPRVEEGDDERPDQRYWWLQLHRLIASKAEIQHTEQQSVLSALERLSEGDYDIFWRASAITYWTDKDMPDLELKDSWPITIEGQNLNIGLVSSGTKFVRKLCQHESRMKLPWTDSSIEFNSSRNILNPELKDFPKIKADKSDIEGSKNDEDSNKEVPKVDIPNETTDENATSSAQVGVVNIPKRVFLGQTVSGSRKVYWEFGHSELTNRHVLIFGSSGMGKTYTIQCLLFELGRLSQNSLIVDYTNGFFDNQLEDEFRNELQPLQHIIRREPLKINPFRQQSDIIGDELLPENIGTTAQRVSGVFSEVYNFGDQQKSALYQAIKAGLESSGAAPLTMASLIPLLEELIEQKGSIGKSAASVVSKLMPFIDQHPFGEEEEGSWEEIFTDMTHHCHIIQLAGFMRDVARLVTEFSLIDLYWYYRSRGTQHNPKVIVLDEVQNMDHREDSPLAQFLREGRKFGFSLILATQIMSNLSKDERDRLFNAAHKLFFKPADTEMRSYAEIAAMSTGEKVDIWIKRLSALKKGECYSLGPSLNESTNHLEVKAFHISVTSLGRRSIHN